MGPAAHRYLHQHPAGCCLLHVSQVLAETANTGTKIVAFDQIDKAPEEKARGITINASHGAHAAVV